MPSPPTTAGSGCIRGFFPQDLDGETGFDAVTALAFFEHVPDEEQAAVARACFDVVRPGGRCILTIPAPAVDRILDVLVKIKVIDGMHEEEHHAYEPEQTGSIFGRAGFGFVARKRFQLGLNNLFVFDAPGREPSGRFRLTLLLQVVGGGVGAEHPDLLVQSQNRQEEARQHDPTTRGRAPTRTAPRPATATPRRGAPKSSCCHSTTDQIVPTRPARNTNTPAQIPRSSRNRPPKRSRASLRGRKPLATA